MLPSPGPRPGIVPTSPVPPTPSVTSTPHARSAAATRAAVRVSWNPSSGCACRSRRNSVSSLSGSSTRLAMRAAPYASRPRVVERFVEVVERGQQGDQEREEEPGAEREVVRVREQPAPEVDQGEVDDESHGEGRDAAVEC